MSEDNTYRSCSQCGRKAEQNRIFVIDGKRVCAACLYNGGEAFEIYPIGFVKNSLERAQSAFGTVGKKGVSRIELFESQRPFLYKLEEERYISVVYYLHQTTSVQSVFKRGLDGKEVGVFASRTPYRLSKIGIQDVKLLKREDTTLYVRNLDAVNHTPVLDIKMSWSVFG